MATVSLDSAVTAINFFHKLYGAAMIANGLTPEKTAKIIDDVAAMAEAWLDETDV